MLDNEENIHRFEIMERREGQSLTLNLNLGIPRFKFKFGR